MYYLLMPSKYTKDLTNILEMLWNIEKDLNLASYSETEKKVYHVIACIYLLTETVILPMLFKIQVFQDQQYIKL